MLIADFFDFFAFPIFRMSINRSLRTQKKSRSQQDTNCLFRRDLMVLKSGRRRHLQSQGFFLETKQRLHPVSQRLVAHRRGE